MQNRELHPFSSLRFFITKHYEVVYSLEAEQDGGSTAGARGNSRIVDVKLSITVKTSPDDLVFLGSVKCHHCQPQLFRLLSLSASVSAGLQDRSNQAAFWKPQVNNKLGWITWVQVRITRSINSANAGTLAGTTRLRLTKRRDLYAQVNSLWLYLPSDFTAHKKGTNITQAQTVTLRNAFLCISTLYAEINSGRG